MALLFSPATLTNRVLTNSVLKYTYIGSDLKLIIDMTSSSHNVKGNVRVILSNCIVVNGVDDANNEYIDFLNRAFVFRHVSSTRLETVINVRTLNLTQTAVENIVENNGSAIAINLNSLYLNIKPGTYNFNIINEEVNGVNFSGTDTDDTNLNKVRFETKNFTRLGLVHVQNESVSETLSQALLEAFFQNDATFGIILEDSSTNVFVDFQNA
jgi:hypothetical protein